MISLLNFLTAPYIIFKSLDDRFTSLKYSQTNFWNLIENHILLKLISFFISRNQFQNTKRKQKKAIKDLYLQMNQFYSFYQKGPFLWAWDLMFAFTFLISVEMNIQQIFFNSCIQRRNLNLDSNIDFGASNAKGAL